MADEKRLTWKRSLDGYEDVGLREGVTVSEAICKLADLEEKGTVEVVHGRWIVGVDGSFRNVKCAACGKDYACHTGMLQLQSLNYCLNCGAKMDGGVK